MEKFCFVKKKKFSQWQHNEIRCSFWFENNSFFMIGFGEDVSNTIQLKASELFFEDFLLLESNFVIRI